MDSGLKISAVAISAKGKGMNLDNVYVNGRYLAPGSDEPQVCIRKTSNVDFQMYGVCDGENAEDVALKTSPSAMVMQRMQQLQSVLSMDGAISRDKIWSFLCETNGKIREYQEAVGSEGVNSTFAGLFLHKNRGLAVHLGDSRIYVIRGGRMLQITEDHLEATDLYKFGIITQEQAEVHKLESRPTATLGMFDIYDVESEVFSKYFVFYPGDLFILCTDGITDSITNQEIERIVRGAKDSPKETIAQQLMQLAKEKNQDDKSIIVLQVEEVMGEGITPAATPARESAPAVQEVAAAEEESEEAPVQKKTSGLGASLAAFAAKVGGSSSQEEPQEAPVEEAPEEEEPVRPVPTRQETVPQEEGFSDNEEQAEEDEDEGDEEITILDKIFGNPKLIFIILASIVVIILLIVLLTSLGGRGGENNSSTSNSSTVSMQESLPDNSLTGVNSSAEVSRSETSVADSSVEESSAAEESSQPEESSVPEESSIQEESSTPEESSQPEESQGTASAATHTIAAGDTFYDLLLRYYDEFSESLLDSFCSYNGITPETVLQPGDTLQIPPRSELN